MFILVVTIIDAKGLWDKKIVIVWQYRKINHHYTILTFFIQYHVLLLRSSLRGCDCRLSVEDNAVFDDCDKSIKASAMVFCVK